MSPGERVNAAYAPKRPPVRILPVRTRYRHDTVHRTKRLSLKEMFKAVYGKSLAAHIKEHRMELASKLLRETGLSIAEIAERVGYENQSKFSAEFKKSVGSLPTEYRKLF